MRGFIVILLISAFSCSLYYEGGEWGMGLTYTNIELDYRNGLYYYLGKPFTGIVNTKYDNNQTRTEQKYKDGKKHGVWEWYYSNGSIMRKEFWKDGVLTNTMDWDR